MLDNSWAEATQFDQNALPIMQSQPVPDFGKQALQFLMTNPLNLSFSYRDKKGGGVQVGSPQGYRRPMGQQQDQPQDPMLTLANLQQIRQFLDSMQLNRAYDM